MDSTTAAATQPGEGLEPVREPGTDGDDPYLWLEEVAGERALSWVAERNSETRAGLAATQLFTSLRDEIRSALDDPRRVPNVVRRAEFLYDFWRDEVHPRGLWRRTTLSEYRTDDPVWEILLDLDDLAREEGENWVWAGAEFFAPANTHCLVSLSRGGSDAVMVREFDPVAKRFVSDGFTVPEARTYCSWIDADTLFVATDRGPGTLTDSGFPRAVVRWSRGTPLTDAVEMHSCGQTDLMCIGWRDHTTGVDLVQVRTGFFTGHIAVRHGAAVTTVDAPDDADLSVQHGWLLIHLRSDWTVDGRTFPEGSLLAERLDVHLARARRPDGQLQAARRLEVVYEPDERSALQSYHWTLNHLLLVLLDNVRTKIEIRTPGKPLSDDAGRSRQSVMVPDWCSADVMSTDPFGSDEFLLAVEGFVRPLTVLRGMAGEERGPVEPEVLKSAPPFFEGRDVEVEQLFATSADGTRIPYFVVGRRSAAPRSVILAGYGGFEVSRLPTYSSSVGRAWLERGGIYVLANIRGGGEFGPRWHRAALRADRRRAYEDFAAVAADLVDRGFTVPERLAAIGGSNGGLLMGNMLTGFGELFGAIVAKVPLFDMRRYHRLLAGALWVAEYGDPDVHDDWDFLRRFSPYHQLVKGKLYPPLLVTTSTKDDRVHPGHSRKLVARMREFGYDPVYFENTEGGHAGAATNEQVAMVDALVYTFLWQTVGGGMAR